MDGYLFAVFVDAVGDADGIEEVFVSSTSAGKGSGSWENRTFRVVCAAGVWIAKSLQEPAPLLWTASGPEPGPVNVTFRFRYRISSGLVLEENVTMTLTNGE
ncbi:UNVERIFIED_CONTAM: hypothetical protein PYX00_008112 [Menopon gallinae]|uniref:Uncharacterized protein n=1 Tax=Menopon gallinae TaxID=328185 RepID=A0AAW2HML7_9NEOP